MEKRKYIEEHIVDHLSDRMDEETIDPVLDEWLAEDESNQKDFERYKEIWKETGTYLERENFDAQYAWDKIDRINKNRDNRRRRLINIGYIVSGVAAALLLVFSFWGRGIFDRQPEMLVRMSADYGSRSEIVLPDGSVVKLNSGSDITYSYNAKEKIREVSFQGEGFFDVSKDKRPFVIKMNNGLRLKVHGTSFNLQAYTDEKTIEASLVEGCIELDHGDDKLLMNAGDMAVFDKRTNEMRPVAGVLSHSYSWLEDKLYMDHMSLASVCKYLERRYDVTIHLQKDLENSIHYDGVIQKETITDILDVLSRLSDISYSVKGKNISITSK
ncbi:FecR family protein [uncultured Parabacteroides sp.]|uniref:FecR family protein n=1 Tax=uncultured Parabacteroides sp. TaxID=512312 RepID=UPI0026331F6B|nr:FecR family protein [uncultured Parabacteroides sp.]